MEGAPQQVLAEGSGLAVLHAQALPPMLTTDDRCLLLLIETKSGRERRVRGQDPAQREETIVNN